MKYETVYAFQEDPFTIDRVSSYFCGYFFEQLMYGSVTFLLLSVYLPGKKVMAGMKSSPSAAHLSAGTFTILQ